MGVYRCKQGWIGITIVTPAQWKSFCDLMGMPELGRDPDHVMGGERLARADALEARFIPRFLDRTAEEWFALGLELRLPFAIVPDMQQVLSWPVFRDRKAIVPITIGDRTVEAPGSPFHLTATPANFGGRVPELGEHNPSYSSPPPGGEARRGGIDVRTPSPPLPRAGRGVMRGRSKACASSTCRWAGPARSARATWPISAPT